MIATATYRSATRPRSNFGWIASAASCGLVRDSGFADNATLLISAHSTEPNALKIVDNNHALFAKALIMIYTIAVILVILWLLGFAVFHVAGGLIHLLLILAVIAIACQLVTGRKVV